ncbi:MAG: S-layer homology domain-containing protein [Fretibacterium sp.]|nr:S-layer homology domain-containing protein [Fretibacterium sp.]
MKKFVTAIAVAVLVAFAAPALAATNPFMDVPMNHWAYDAIGQLAAHGVLSGYPDGLYRGKQPTTRYEMASALARALALVDMTKASKQDVEMLKKLVIEFKDELEALGVRVDDLDKRVAVIEDRLGGWKLSGQLRVDITDQDRDPDPDSAVKVSRARIFMDRWFGEDESMHFHARLDGTNGPVSFSRFFVEMPFFWDSQLTVGRFSWDMEEDYYLGGSTSIFGIMSGGLDSILTDRVIEGFGWTKNFGMGNFRAYLAHPRVFTDDTGLALSGNPLWGFNPETGNFGSLRIDAWELMMMAQLQFTEQFGFDIGAQVFFGDNAWNSNFSFENLWTIFAGLRFNFNENIALKGIFYHQQANVDFWGWTGAGWGWIDANLPDANAYKAIVDVKQDALKFTSLWLEYAHYDGGFVIPTGVNSLFYDDISRSGLHFFNSVLPTDLSVWRVAGKQNWNEKWSTFFYVAGYNADNLGWNGLNWVDAKAFQWGLGILHYYNPNVTFGLSYSNIDWKRNAENTGFADDHVFRFRTHVSF